MGTSAQSPVIVPPAPPGTSRTVKILWFALAVVTAFAAYELIWGSGLIDGGKMLGGPGDTPITVGDGSFFIDGSGLNDPTKWDVQSESITPKAKLKVSRIEYATEGKGKDDVVELCSKSGTVHCDANTAVKLTYKDGPATVVLQFGMNGSINTASGSAKFNDAQTWPPFGKNQKYRNANNVKVDDITVNGLSPSNLDKTKRLRLIVYF